MKYTIKKAVLTFISSLITFLVSGQIGIGTNTPNGALEVNSSFSGIVFPVVSLTATNVPSPVINPNSGAIVAGTVVYNTNENDIGNESVYPGPYMWNGSAWIPQFSKRQSQIFLQTTGALRTKSNTGFEDVPNIGIVDNQFFKPKYNGFYRIEIRVNFGGGRINSPVTGSDNAAYQDGTFRFAFDGNNYDLNVKSISSYDNSEGSTIFYDGAWKESYLLQYLNLTAGQEYHFNLTFDQSASPEFLNSGNSGGGRGYVGKEIPCSIEFTYVENYTADQ